jgi:tRNA threonylcarbamoyladenosine biosynthesis protein TsaB
MKILALDTSTEHCTVALRLGDVVLLRETRAGQRHSELVLPMVQSILAEAGLRLQNLDGIAFGAGPGSFTGLRIACGVAQGLAFGAELPVAAISTLEALAQASGGERVIACLDARMSEVYHALYEKSAAGWHLLSAPGLYTPAEVPGVDGANWTGCGSGFAVYSELLRSRYGAQLGKVDGDLYPHAREIAVLAQRVFQANAGVAAWEAAPLYIRDKVALQVSER